MTEFDDTPTRYSRASVILGWLIALIYTAHGALTVFMPRTEKVSALREDLRSWHYLLGLTLLVLLGWRLVRWFRDGRVTATRGLTGAGHQWTRQLAGATYGVLVLMPVLGIIQAWTEGLTVRLGPLVTLPALIPANHVGWMFTGYFHSALGFAVTLLTVVACGTGAYLRLRRGPGLLAAFPPGFGAQAWITVAITVYAFSTFKSPAPGPRAVGIYVALTLVIWALGAWRAGRRGTAPATRSIGPGVRAGTTVGVLALIGLASYGPHAMFRVTPWPMGEVVAAAEGVTSHDAPIGRVTVTPETDFERQVKAETYKWCRFCHTVEKGGKHLVGPNLYAVFGQRAGTAPNYYYSTAMAAAGRKGLVWDDDSLDKLLAGPDQFMPGTKMIISSGPVKTPAERAAVINILKRETMSGAY